MKLYRVYTDDIDGDYDVKYYINIDNVADDIGKYQDSITVRRCEDIETEDD